MIVAAIIQARLGSQRFPAKVLKRIDYQTMLTHVLARAKLIPGVSTIMVATTTAERDDAIANLCRGAGVRWCRGSERDVLARYVLAAELTRADVILRLTSDCPLLDPEVAGLVLASQREQGASYVSNVHPPSWHDGCDAEAFTRAALEVAHAEAGPDEREHVTTFLWRRSERFRVANVALPGGEDHSLVKLSVDTAEDLARVRAVHGDLRPRDATGWRATLAAHARQFPSPVEVQARRIFTALPRCADRRAAYAEGVHAAAGTVSAGVPCPYSTQQQPLRVAWHLGWEDVTSLGRRELASG